MVQRLESRIFMFNVILRLLAASTSTLQLKRIRTDNPFVSVDAVKFVSHKNDKNCAHCIRFHYEIERQPPFKDNKLQYTTKNTFIDWSSAIDQMYNYTVHLVGNDGTRYHSIQTVYEAAKKRCGDGVLDEETEECDDGNANELDGCSQFCRLDLGYLCNDALDTNNSLVLVKATDYRLISDGEFVCQLNEMSQPAAIAQCESYDQLSDCYEMTAKMNSTIEAEFELVHPKALFVAFAPLPSKHQNNDSIDLELTTANNVKFKVDGLSLQSCTQSPLIIPIPNMSDNHDFISRLRLSVPTNYGIITIGLLVDSVYYSKAVQQCLQISNPFISTTKSNCMYSAKSSTLLSCGDVPLNEHANEFFGDGWCDFQNNRQYCHFDGGDCCNSTVSTRRVRLMFPMLCTHHLCQCIDPMAVENRGLRLLDPNEGLWFGRRLRSTRHIDAGHQDVSSANPSIQIARNVELIALQSPRTNNHFGLFTRLHENWRQRSSKAEMHENNFMTND
ncbi:hypothetical protein M3Y96_00346900 [Aphelenchoides besseyi]|nr:hypothetical protein M3Y96_00346900 [Aphelenchoides besseyi]